MMNAWRKERWERGTQCWGRRSSPLCLSNQYWDTKQLASHNSDRMPNDWDDNHCNDKDHNDRSHSMQNQIQYSQQYRRVLNKNGVMGTCEMCLSSCASHEQQDTVGEVRHDNSMSLVTIFTQTKTQTWDWHLAAGMQTPEYLPSSYNTSLVVNKYYFPHVM